MYSLEALEVRNASGTFHGATPRGPDGTSAGEPALEPTLVDFMADVKPEHKAIDSEKPATS